MFFHDAFDDASLYLLQNIWYSQGLAQQGWVSTGHDVPYAEMRTDFTGARYFTRGYRGVFWLSGAPIALTETVSLPWHEPPAH